VAKYRKKPVVVEAEVYKEGMEDGWGYEDRLPPMKIGTYADLFENSKIIDGVRMFPYINTLEGRHYISKGDYIITGIKGERYPCKPDIFEATYERVE
jgi:hypothetical protein